MVVYRLSCHERHEFEGWFASSEEFERQKQAGLISCPACNDTVIERLPSAPYVSTPRQESPAEAATLAQAVAIVRQAVAQIKSQSEDTGEQFAEEARRIHYNQAPARSIHGQATWKDYEELSEEGIDVLPLPAFPEPGQLH